MQLSSILFWTRKVFISFWEQGLYSLPNFLLNILLARWWSVEEYGSFAFGFSIFLLLSGVHTAFILEPMIVFAPAKYPDQLFSYLKWMIKFHLILTSGMAILGMLSSLIVKQIAPTFVEGIFAASFSLPFILLFWLFRRASYMFSTPQTAAKGSLVYAITLAFIFIFRTLAIMNITNTFILMDIGSVLASVVVWLSLEPVKTQSQSNLSYKSIWADHWKYGQWAMGSSLVSWGSSMIAIPLLGIFLGLAQAGIYRALQNLILPLQQISAALDSLFIPWLSRQARTERLASRFIDRAKILLIAYLAIGVAYLVTLAIASDPLIRILYGKSEYTNYTWLVLLLGVLGTLDILAHSLAAVLRALQKPKGVFFAQLMSAITSLVFSILLINSLGIRGAAYATVISGIVMVAFLSGQFKQNLRKPAHAKDRLETGV